MKPSFVWKSACRTVLAERSKTETTKRVFYSASMLALILLVAHLLQTPAKPAALLFNSGSLYLMLLIPGNLSEMNALFPCLQGLVTYLISAQMACLSTGVRIVLCMTLSVLLIKIVSDRQQFRWRPNELPGSENDVESDKCPDIILGPDPRTDWPTWLPYAKELATEVTDADAGEVSSAHSCQVLPAPLNNEGQCTETTPSTSLVRAVKLPCRANEVVHTCGLLQGFDVLFYGDSITEQWRGSSVGTMYPSLVQTHEVFDARFNKNYSSHVLAIAGAVPYTPGQSGHCFQLPSAMAGANAKIRGLL